MDWISDLYSSKRGWGHLEDLVDIGDRMAGSRGERRAAELTMEALQSIGLREVELDEFGLTVWRRGDSFVRTSGGDEHGCIALPRSPVGEVSGELVDVGYGLKDDFTDDLEGCVVMASSDVPGYLDRFIHRREKYRRAVEAGAVGFIYRNHIDGCLAPTGALSGKVEEIGEIPGVGVSKEVGVRLGRRWGGEMVSVGVDADVFEGSSQNVVGRLGPGSDEFVLVCCHVDSHDISEGAMDNGAGTAMLVEVASVLSEMEGDLGVDVVFGVYGAEEVGLIGSRHHREEVELGSVRVVLNLDGVVRGRNLQAVTNCFDGVEGIVDGVSEDIGVPVEVVPRHRPHSDHWSFVRAGIPSIYVLSRDGSRDRGWGHTAADTIDKLDIRDFREQCIVVVELIRRLCEDDVDFERKEREELMRELDEQGFLESLRISGDIEE